MNNPAQVHISQVQPPTVREIRRMTLLEDVYHRRIAEGARILAGMGAENLRYSTQYDSGTTVWVDDPGDPQTILLIHANGHVIPSKIST